MTLAICCLGLVTCSQNYVERTFENDVAVLELDTPVEFRPYIVLICLPSASDGAFKRRKAVVAGWGDLEQRKASLDSLAESLNKR